jgi:hypothetical protein
VASEESSLEYAGPGALREKSRVPGKIAAIVLIAMTGLAVFTCLRIEILNAKIGFYLPRDFSTDSGTWRQTMITNETRWRSSHANLDPTIATRPLTVAERSRMNADMSRNHAWNALLDTVGTLGCLQYPLLFVLIISLPFNIREQTGGWRVALLVSLALALVCGGLMFYRGYYTSLGW